MLPVRASELSQDGILKITTIDVANRVTIWLELRPFTRFNSASEGCGHVQNGATMSHDLVQPHSWKAGTKHRSFPAAHSKQLGGVANEDDLTVLGALEDVAQQLLVDVAGFINEDQVILFDVSGAGRQLGFHSLVVSHYTQLQEAVNGGYRHTRQCAESLAGFVGSSRQHHSPIHQAGLQKTGYLHQPRQSLDQGLHEGGLTGTTEALDHEDFLGGISDERSKMLVSILLASSESNCHGSFLEGWGFFLSLNTGQFANRYSEQLGHV